MNQGMPKTRYIHLKRYDRQLMLDEKAESKSIVSYKEPLTDDTRELEMKKCIEALINYKYPKAREHAQVIQSNERIVKGPLYKFTEIGIRKVGYYDHAGRLVIERGMSAIEVAKLEEQE